MTAPTPYERFLALHSGPGAFVMPNPWDGASAKVLAHAGFEALGSTSYGLAFSLGRPDGSHAVSRDEAIAHAAFLARVSGLPINGDLEDGFGFSPEDCAATVRAAIDAGLAGIGIEDTTADPEGPIHCFDAAVARVKAAAAAARGRIVLTGRTDNYFNGRPDLDDTIRRLTAFAEAGADVLYAPGLPDMDAIVAVVKAVAPKPVNVLRRPRRRQRFAREAIGGGRSPREHRRRALSVRDVGACRYGARAARRQSRRRHSVGTRRGDRGVL